MESCLHTISEEALEVYDTFTFTEDEENKIGPLIKKFDDCYTPKKNTTYTNATYSIRACIVVFKKHPPKSILCKLPTPNRRKQAVFYSSLK